MKIVIMLLSAFFSLGFLAQDCLSLSLNKNNKDDYEIKINEDSGGDFYFSNSEDLIINNLSKVSIIFEEKRFTEYYTLEVLLDGNTFQLNDSTLNKMCGEVVELRIVLNNKTIQKKILKFN